MEIATLLLVSTLAALSPVDLNSDHLCDPVTSEESLPDVAERLKLEWLSRADTVTGHTALGEHDQGTTLSIESVTETAVTTVQPQADVRYSQYFDLDSERKYLCVSD